MNREEFFSKKVSGIIKDIKDTQIETNMILNCLINLGRYARHKKDCKCLIGPDHKCDCGLEQVLEHVRYLIERGSDAGHRQSEN